MSDVDQYESLLKAGATHSEIYEEILSDGLTEVDAIRILREIGGLSFPEIKRIRLARSGIESTVEEHEEKLIPGIKAVLERDP